MMYIANAIDMILADTAFNAIHRYFIVYLMGAVVFSKRSGCRVSGRMELFGCLGGFVLLNLVGVFFGAVAAKLLVIIYLLFVIVLWRSIWFWGAVVTCLFAVVASYFENGMLHSAITTALVLGLGAVTNYCVEKRGSHVL